jgi:DNA sulfur modification protein DndC
VWVLSSNTLVESPQVLSFVRQNLDDIKVATLADGLPIEVYMVEPQLNDTFFVKVLGYGYPAPNKWFRWCTDRLKIQPANRFIQSRIAEGNEVVLLLGTRYDESRTRARSVRKHEGEWELNAHSTLKGALVFAPIKHLLTEEVWEFLTTNPPPWGGSHLHSATCTAMPTPATVRWWLTRPPPLRQLPVRLLDVHGCRTR